MTPTLQIQMQFLSAQEGGRKKPPLVLRSGNYRPHFCVLPDTTYLGVQFIDGPDETEPNVVFTAKVSLIFEVDYSALTPGAHFEVMEGPMVVGRGVVV